MAHLNTSSASLTMSRFRAHLLWKTAVSSPPLHPFHQSPVFSLGSSSTAAQDNTQKWVRIFYCQALICNLSDCVSFSAILGSKCCTSCSICHKWMMNSAKAGKIACVCSYPSHDANSVSGQEARIADFIIHYAVKHLLFIISWEWRLYTQTHMHKANPQFNSLRDLKFTNPSQHDVTMHIQVLSNTHAVCVILLFRSNLL